MSVMRALGPIIAALLGFITVVCNAFGVPPSVIFALCGCTTIAAILALMFRDERNPTTAIIAPVLAIITGSLPFVIPAVRDLRTWQLARARAVETAPMYAAFNKIVADFTPEVQRYHKEHDLLPDFNGAASLPYVNAKGALTRRPANDRLSPPADPFVEDGRSLRWIAIRDEGVLLVSVGQDGAAELPLPGPPLDPAPAHPLAGFAQTGVDPRTAFYDAANGALGLGDVAELLPLADQTRASALGPLLAAWDLAKKTTRYAPTQGLGLTEKDPSPQSSRDASGAMQLLEQNEDLAAVALASRGLRERSPYIAQWTDLDGQLERVAGVGLYHLGAYRAAADSLIMGLENRPNDVEAHFMLGCSYYATNERELAVRHWMIAAQIDPGGGKVCDQAGAAAEALRNNGRPEIPRPRILPPLPKPAPPPNAPGS